MTLRHRWAASAPRFVAAIAIAVLAGVAAGCGERSNRAIAISSLVSASVKRPAAGTIALEIESRSRRPITITDVRLDRALRDSLCVRPPEGFTEALPEASGAARGSRGSTDVVYVGRRVVPPGTCAALRLPTNCSSSGRGHLRVSLSGDGIHGGIALPVQFPMPPR